MAAKACFCLQSPPSSDFKPQPCKTALNLCRGFCCIILIISVIAMAMFVITYPVPPGNFQRSDFFCKTVNDVSLQQAKILHFTGVPLPSKLTGDSHPKQKWFWTIHAHASMFYKTSSARRSSRS